MKKTTAAALGWGAAAAFASSLLLAAVLAAAIRAGALPQGAMAYLCWGVSLLAGLLGGMTAAKRAGKLRLPLALAAAGVYLLVSFILRGLIFRSVSPQPWWIPIFTAAGAVLGALAASGGKKKKRRV